MRSERFTSRRARFHVFPPFLAGERRQQQGKLDVLERGQNRNQVEVLKHESHVLVAPAGQLVLVEGGQVLSQNPELAAGGPVDSGNQVEQRALARAGGSHQADEVLFTDVQVDVLQRHDLDRIALEHPGQIAHFDQHVGHPVSPAVVSSAPDSGCLRKNVT